MSLRVAFVMPGVGVVERGAEAFVVELCEALQHRHGFETTLLCRGVPPRHLPGRRIRALPRDRGWVNALYRATPLTRKALDTLFLDPLNLEWSTAALFAFPVLWRGGYDVVVMEGGLPGAWLCRLLRRWRGVPFIDIAHGNSPKWEGAFARQNPDRVVAFTRAAAAMIRRRAPRARVDVIPHGVPLDRFHPAGPAATPDLPHPVFLTAGAMEAHKCMDLTVRAVAGLATGSLVILGDGPQAQEIDALAHRLLGRERYLRTQTDRAAIPRWYRGVDVFTLASRTESFGLVYLEAMACGVPCVARDDEVRREVVADGGLLCDVEEIELYTTALRRAAQQNWGDRPRRRAERFPFSRTAAAYATLLQEVARCAG